MTMENAAPMRDGEALLEAASRADGRPGTVRLLASRCTKYERDRALIKAAQNGHLAAVRELIQLIRAGDPKDNASEALYWAVHYGHSDVVHELISVSDPKNNNSLALRRAASGGYLNVVRELVPVSDPKANDSEALRLAALCNHLDVVKVLIPVSDPRAEESRALRVAARDGNADVVRELVPVSDTARVFQGELEKVVRAVREEGIEEVERQKVDFPSLRAVNALTPHMGENLLEQTVRDLPEDLLKLLPHLAAWRERMLVREAIESYALATPRRRRSL
ncbi:MAG: ankyrin repeat domain-containing protein [Rhodanobacteraceae bacterium]|nr:ankyrin repeat domain-containing protein [Rhodanobacteraceae bacterium]